MQLHKAAEAEHQGAFLHTIAAAPAQKEETLKQQVAFGLRLFPEPIRVALLIFPYNIVCLLYTSMLQPKPPKNCLTTMIAKRLPKTAIQKGMVGGRL